MRHIYLCECILKIFIAWTYSGRPWLWPTYVKGLGLCLQLKRSGTEYAAQKVNFSTSAVANGHPLPLWKVSLGSEEIAKQNRNCRPNGEGRSGRRPLLPKRKLNILVDLTLGKSYHSVVTFLHAQKIKCHTFSIQTSSKLISYYVCPWKTRP